MFHLLVFAPASLHLTASRTRARTAGRAALTALLVLVPACSSGGSIGTGEGQSGGSAPRPRPSSVDSDLDGDGLADLIVGSHQYREGGAAVGAVFVFWGSQSPLEDRLATSADIQVLGPGPGSEFGRHVLASDVSGDGASDLIVSAPGFDGTGTDDGAVYVFYGPLDQAGTIGVQEADLVLTAEPGTVGDQLGSMLATGDLNGDRRNDLVVGALRHDQPATNAGAVYVFFGGAGLALATTEEADVKLTGSNASAQFGFDLAIGDVDANGELDLAVGAPLHASTGAVFVFRGGSALASGSATSADLVFSGEAAANRFGKRVAIGDVDADDRADLVASAPALGSVSSERLGAVYVFFGGPALAGGNAAAADAIVSGVQSQGELGEDLALGDVDGDTVLDVIAAARGFDATTSNVGAVYVFPGWPGFAHQLASAADVVLTGESITNESFGSTLEVVDVDGDGTLDVCGSALQVGPGKVHVFLGGSGLANRSAANDDATFRGAQAGGGFGVSVAPSR